MKLTYRNDKTENPDHNVRLKQNDLYEHDFQCWIYDATGEKSELLKGASLKSAEIKTYTDLFEDQRKATDEHNRKKGKKRIPKMETYYDMHRPKETILQIGDMNNHASPEQFEKCVSAYCEWFKNKFAGHIQILSVSLHFDEKTPHAHMRTMGYCKSARGYLKAEYETPLKEMGYDKPDKEEDEGRYNNRSMTFTGECREQWLHICRTLCPELDIEDYEHGKGISHKSVNEYIVSKQQEDIAYNKAVIAHNEKVIEDQITQVNRIANYLTDTLQKTEAVKKMLIDRVSEIDDIEIKLTEHHKNAEVIRAVDDTATEAQEDIALAQDEIKLKIQQATDEKTEAKIKLKPHNHSLDDIDPLL